MSTVCSTVGKLCQERKPSRPPLPMPPAPTGMSTVCSTSCRTTSNERHDRRRFHQLSRRLRLAQNRTRRTGWRRDLGHSDNLLGHRAVQGSECIYQLLHHLRHRSNVGELLHSVPLHLSLLWWLSWLWLCCGCGFCGFCGGRCCCRCCC